MSGCWVLVCGPSGASKDSVTDWARHALTAHPRVCFARRLVTRASGASADQDEIGVAAMHALRRAGRLAWHWHAHGLQYGVLAEYGRRVRAGDVVVVNGSREHALPLAGRSDVRVVLVAPWASRVSEQLLLGGEETAAGGLPMRRNTVLVAPPADRLIASDGPIAIAGGALRDYLLELVR